MYSLTLFLVVLASGRQTPTPYPHLHQRVLPQLRVRIRETFVVSPTIVFPTDDDSCVCKEAQFCDDNLEYQIFQRINRHRCDEGEVCCYHTKLEVDSESDGEEMNDVHRGEDETMTTTTTSSEWPVPEAEINDEQKLPNEGDNPKIDKEQYEYVSSVGNSMSGSTSNTDTHTKDTVHRDYYSDVTANSLNTMSEVTTEASNVSKEGKEVTTEETPAEKFDLLSAQGSEDKFSKYKAPKIECGMDKRNRLFRNKRETSRSDRHATMSEYPWTVLILRKPNGILCSGALISSSHVITAAHCMMKNGVPRNLDTLTVRVGEYDTKDTFEMLPHQDFSILKVIPHYNYSVETEENDMALLKLSSPVNLTLDNINKICLPEPNETALMSPCIVTGWGSTVSKNGILMPNSGPMKKMRMRKISRRMCVRRLKGVLGEKFFLPKHIICALPLDEDNDTSLGDGGGPLFCRSSKRPGMTLFGVVSTGVISKDPGIPGLYFSVRRAREWIDDEIYFPRED